MRKPEWPGIATASALICAGAIIFAIWRDPEGFRLKDWQTLMAACVALIAGTLAYKGAMAKVDLDREIHDKQTDKQEFGVYLRLRSTLKYVQNFSRVAAATINAFRTNQGAGSLRVSELGPGIRFDVDEAWNNLDIFETNVAEEIAEIKTHLDAFYYALTDWKALTWQKTQTFGVPDDAVQFEELCNRLNTHSRSLIRTLTLEINKP